MKKTTIGAGELYIHAEPERNLTFHDEANEIIGEVRWDDGVLTFEGNVEGSAKKFFNFLIQLSKKHNEKCEQ